MRRTERTEPTGLYRNLDQSFSSHVSRAATVAAAAFLTFSFSLLLVRNDPQLIAAGEPTTAAMPFLFLVHGISVFAAWLYRWWAIVYVLPGILLAIVLFPVASSSPHLMDAPWLISISSLITAPLAFGMMDWAGINEKPSQRLDRRSWRVLVLGGLKASLFGFLLRSVFVSNTQDVQVLPLQAIRSISAEMLGLCVCVFALMLMFRYIRGSQRA